MRNNSSQKLIEFVITLFFALPLSWGHPGGHEHDPAVQCKDLGNCTKKEIETAGYNILRYMVEHGFLHLSWKESEILEPIEDVSFREKRNFLAKFENRFHPEGPKVFYILISPAGAYVDSGKDPSLYQKIQRPNPWIGFSLIALISVGFYFFYLRKQKRSSG